MGNNGSSEEEEEEEEAEPAPPPPPPPPPTGVYVPTSAEFARRRVPTTDVTQQDVDAVLRRIVDAFLSRSDDDTTIKIGRVDLPMRNFAYSDVCMEALAAVFRKRGWTASLSTPHGISFDIPEIDYDRITAPVMPDAGDGLLIPRPGDLRFSDAAMPSARPSPQTIRYIMTDLSCAGVFASEVTSAASYPMDVKNCARFFFRAGWDARVTDYCLAFRIRRASMARNEVRFYSTRGAYGCLSNFSRHPIVLDEVRWPTAEHRFQALKSVDPADREAIRSCRTPTQAKRFGRIVPLREDWDKGVRDDVMYETVRAKFAQNPECARVLVSTGGARLVEDANNDAYWGCGADGKGENRLGEILMHVRAELIEKEEEEEECPRKRRKTDRP